jgi:prepilin-type N-terminal cleavage/methylation domain-containing protein
MMETHDIGAGADARQAGITLIELVVALVVVALALAAAGTALRLLGRSGERGTRLIAQQEMLSRGIDAVRRDIERLLRVARNREGRAEFVFRGDARSLVFVVVEPPVPSEAGPYFILYSAAESDGVGALVRSRAPYDAAAKDLNRLRGQDEVTVLEGRYSFRFAYFDSKGGREGWRARWQDPSRIPDLIRLEVSSGGDGADLPPLIFRPRADAEPGCIKEQAANDKFYPCTLRAGGVLAQPVSPTEPKR